MWLLVFSAIILIFGLLFAFLTPIGHGMIIPGDVDQSLDVWRGIYFSVVTVSSLGYGDLHPAGAGKVLVGIEVVLGLAVIGIVIAKLTSKRVSHFTSRLFVSETKRQLQSFKSLFDACVAELRMLLDEISREYQQIPGETTNESERSSDVGASFGNALDKLLDASTDLHDYIQAEGWDRSYFSLAPVVSFNRLSVVVQEALFLLGQCIVNLPVKSNPHILTKVLTNENRRKIDRTVNLQRAICDTVFSGRHVNSEVEEEFRRIEKLCERIGDWLLPWVEQPDQLLDAS